MSEAQKKTITQYYDVLRIQSVASAFRLARRHGLFAQLASGMMTKQELQGWTGWSEPVTNSCVSLLVANGILECYGDDIALSQAANLMLANDSPNDPDLFEQAERSNFPNCSDDRRNVFRRRLIDRQWTQTSAAIQASEVLDIGGQRKGLKVLELGCGAGVWSAAMAYRDPIMQITVVDHAPMLEMAAQTFNSVGLEPRINRIEGDYRRWDVPLGTFDLVVLSGTLQLEEDADAVILLGRSADALKIDGEILIVEPLREEDGPLQAISAQAFELAVGMGTQLRSVASIQRLLFGSGFGDAQWGWLTADPNGLGIILAKKTHAD